MECSQYKIRKRHTSALSRYKRQNTQKGVINKGKVISVHCCLLGPDKNSIPVTQALQKQGKLKQPKDENIIQQIIKS